MDDSQSPPDADSRAGSRKGDPARRSSVGLRDAEEGAATRRDRLGDGSLIEPQAPPLARAEEQSRAAAATEPAEWRHATAQKSVNDDAPHMHAADAPDSSNPPEAAPEPGQSLDAFIDSIPADPRAPPEGQAPRAPAAATGFLVPPERYQVSAIFEGLASRRQHAEQTNGAEPPLEAADADSDAASTDAGASEAADEPATPPTQPAGAAPGFSVPLFYQPVASVPMPEPSDWPPFEAPAGDDAGNKSGWAGAADDRPPGQADTSERPPRPAAAAGSAAEAAPFPQPADWPPSMPLADAQADDHTHEQPPSADPAHNGGVEPFPEPLGWPPFPEPPGSQATNAVVEPLKPPSLVTDEFDASGSPFPARPAWPPFPDSPGDDSGLSARAPSVLPPYIELPAHPDMEEPTTSGPADLAEPSVRGETLRFAGPRGMLPAFDDLTGAPAPRDPREVPRFHNIEAGEPAAIEPPSKASAAASAKIEAEVNATAQALDNLQRLLNRTAAPAAPPPSQQSPQQPFRPQAAPHRPHNPHFPLPQDDPFVHELAPMPLPMPLPVLPTEDASDRKVYLLGFLTGLVLSVMAGAALYFLINFR